ncbi:unnamed protein product, partial [Diplocarpon coronariae]
ILTSRKLNRLDRVG